MVLQFGRDICGNLSTAQQREWLVTNGIGGYACGTVAGLLTRHYHGLLVAALKPPLERTLLLTKLDEQVTYGGQAYSLHTDRWADGTVSPEGYRYIERFILEGTIPTWTYAFGDALLKKRIWMEPGANTTYIRYSLKRGSEPVTLFLKALVNYRNHHHSTRGQNWSMQIQPISQGIRVTAFKGASPFYVLADGGSWMPHHDWYRGYDLAVERYRGIDPYDDHLHGATFEVELSAEQSFTIAASTEAPESIQFQAALKRRRRHEQQLLGQWYSARYLTAKEAPLWMEQLVLAADQFVVARPVEGEPEGKTIIAGYPWFGDWGRDTMIALPGLAIATGRPDIARPILKTFAKYLDQGMLPNLFPEAGQTPEYNTVDAILWYFEAIRVYYSVTHDCLLLEELFSALAEVIRWHQQGTRYNIHLDSDGLIYAGEVGTQLTWMDAKVGDWVVTPRIGKPIEVNALWYNALLTMARFADLLGVSGSDYRLMAEQTRHGFQRFWSDELGYCYDVLDGPEGNDPSLRPNQIFAVAFPAADCWRSDLYTKKPAGTQLLGPPLLSTDQQKAVVDQVARQLLTSHGLRSLDPRHPKYSGHYGGNPLQRDGHYHQGTVWGWLIGPFIQAHLQVYQDPAIARSFLEPLADHLRDGCIGTLSEIFDGNAPMIPRGAFAQAWTVAEVLRAGCLIDNDSAAL
ncbi:MAG: glycogen debranching enzyme family protein [Leptolyngbya sp. SIO1E4]|nr:glycogen debranching enzyme family protein [Leptolyngbya sp. SIO1E4]